MEKELKEFHEKYGHFISTKPTADIPFVVKKLRFKLIMEEIQETVKAMGFNVYGDFDSADEDLLEIADGIADSIYVLVGTAISYGIPIERVFREVHRSNMTKTAVKAENGEKYGTKTPKGPDFIPPHIWRILFEPEYETQLEQKAELLPLEIKNDSTTIS